MQTGGHAPPALRKGSADLASGPNAADGLSGGAFLGGERFFGLINFTERHIRFVSNTGKAVDLPIDRLNLRSGGAGGNTLFFTHPLRPDWTLFTSDTSVLQTPALNANKDAANQIRRIRSKRQRSSMILTSFLVLLIALLWAALAAKDPLVRMAADRIPVKWEERLGEAAFSQVSREMDFQVPAELENELNRILAPLCGAAGRNIDLHIAREEQINAFALPGGIMVLNTGLIAAAQTPEEIAAVMAHEMAHIQYRHGLRQLISSAGIYLTAQLLFGDASGLAAMTVDGGSLLLTRRYSRDAEREADDSGWELLQEANIHPGGMIRFFERLQAEEVESAGAAERAMTDALGFLGTHPALEERIERLKSKPVEGEFPPLPSDMYRLHQLAGH